MGDGANGQVRPVFSFGSLGNRVVAGRDSRRELRFNAEARE